MSDDEDWREDCALRRILELFSTNWTSMVLVHRHVEVTIPPAAEYSMTDLRKRFVEPIEMIYAWARENNDALDALKPRETSRRSM